MSDLLPLFPLNMVAFPGLTVPLHIFEDRYRAMVQHLREIPDPADRLFGIVAIREGYEVGGSSAQSMYRTGCVVQLATVGEYDDGRFDIAAIGRHRMRVLSTDASAAFLQAAVEPLAPVQAASPDEAVDTAREAARSLADFEGYRDALGELSGERVLTGPLPRDPEQLSFALAAACSLTLAQRQQLLESPATLERLRLLRRLMRQELAAMQAIPSLPATEVARTGWSPN